MTDPLRELLRDIGARLRGESDWSPAAHWAIDAIDVALAQPKLTDIDTAGLLAELESFRREFSTLMSEFGGKRDGLTLEQWVRALVAEQAAEIERLKGECDKWVKSHRLQYERAKAAERALAERRPLVRHVTARLPNGNLLALRISHIEGDWTGLGIFIEGVPVLAENAGEIKAQALREGNAIPIPHSTGI
jgi:hypothetical protein